MKKVVRRAGFPVVLTCSLGVEATSHQCGTAVMGVDPGASVVDADLRAHDLDNLWIADTSTFRRRPPSIRRSPPPRCRCGSGTPVR